MQEDDIMTRGWWIYIVPGELMSYDGTLSDSEVVRNRHEVGSRGVTNGKMQ